MNYSPTPETDAAVVDGIDCYGDPLKYWNNFTKHAEVVQAEFARRLERERDEARRELSALKAKMEGGSESYSILNTMLEEALRERDEAMRGVEILKRALLKEKAK